MYAPSCSHYYKLIMFNFKTLLSRVRKVFALIFALLNQFILILWVCVCFCVWVWVHAGSGWWNLCFLCRGNAGEDGGAWGHRSEWLPRWHVEPTGLFYCYSGVSGRRFPSLTDTHTLTQTCTCTCPYMTLNLSQMCVYMCVFCVKLRHLFNAS